MSRNVLWNYREPNGDSILGYDVEATNGPIGAVDESTDDLDASYIVVDTGWWIFGKKRLLPAGVIDRIDPAGRTVFVNLTKEQVKDAPDLDDQGGGHGSHRRGTEIARDMLVERFGTYFGPHSWK